MHVSAKKMAFLGLMLALAVLLVILSGILEFNTLFLLAGASFGVGIAIRECGQRLGVGFYIASVLLSFMIAPNKIYCITFAAFGFYIMVSELMWEKLANMSWSRGRGKALWITKYVIFNLMYVPAVVFFPQLIYQGKLSDVFIVGLLAAGQIAIFIFDKAYHYFQLHLWGKVRRHLWN